MGECVECGVQKLCVYRYEYFEDDSWKVSWRCFEQDVVGVTDEGKPKKRIKEASKETSPSVFLDYLQLSLQVFIKHNFVARWQDNQCRLSMVTPPIDAIFTY